MPGPVLWEGWFPSACLSARFVYAAKLHFVYTIMSAHHHTCGASGQPPWLCTFAFWSLAAVCCLLSHYMVLHCADYLLSATAYAPLRGKWWFNWHWVPHNAIWHACIRVTKSIWRILITCLAHLLRKGGFSLMVVPSPIPAFPATPFPPTMPLFNPPPPSPHVNRGRSRGRTRGVSGAAGTSTQVQQCQSPAQDPVQEAPSTTELLDLPDSLLAKIFTEVDDVWTKHALYSTCRELRQSDAINATVHHLRVPCGTSIYPVAERVRSALSRYPRFATLKSLTLGEPYCTCRTQKPVGLRTWGSDDECDGIAEGNTRVAHGSHRTHHHDHHGDEGHEEDDSEYGSEDMEGEDEWMYSEGTSDGLSESEEDDDVDDDDDYYDEDDDHMTALLNIFRTCCADNRAGVLLSGLETLTLQNWQLLECEAFGVGCMLASCCPSLKTLSLCGAAFDPLPASLLAAPPLQKLQCLNIDKCMVFNEASIKVISQMTGLKHLKLHMIAKADSDDDEDEEEEEEEAEEADSIRNLQPWCALRLMESLDLSIADRDCLQPVQVMGLDKLVDSCIGLRDLKLRGVVLEQNSPKIFPRQLHRLSLSQMPAESLCSIQLDSCSALRSLHLGVLAVPTDHNAQASLRAFAKKASSLKLECPVNALYLQSETCRNLSFTSFGHVVTAVVPWKHLEELHLRSFILSDTEACVLRLLPGLKVLHLNQSSVENKALSVVVSALKQLEQLRLGPCTSSQITPGDVRMACSVALSTLRKSTLHITCVNMHHLDYDRCSRWVMCRGIRGQHVQLEIVSYSCSPQHMWQKRVKIWGADGGKNRVETTM